MKNFIEFVKKFKTHILGLFLFIFFMRSCVKSGEVRKLEKLNREYAKEKEKGVQIPKKVPQQQQQQPSNAGGKKDPSPFAIRSMP